MVESTNRSRYEVTHFDTREVRVFSTTHDELQSLDINSVDHYVNMDWGIMSFRTAKGKRVQRKLWVHSFGPVCMKILELIQSDPGIFFEPDEVANLTGISSLERPGVLSARWMALRKIHQETARAPYYFLTRKFPKMAIGWNAECSFIHIIRIKELSLIA